MRSSPSATRDLMTDRPPFPERAAWLARWAYAHRGLHGPGIPENSPAAFAAAIARGLGIECDVQRSRDGQAMVFHDWELDRLTDESGPVSMRSAAELGAIGLSGNGDPVPSLREVLALVAGRVPLLIEVKSKRGLPVHHLCQALWRDIERYSGVCAVMSFDPRVSRWFAHHAAHVVRGLVVTEENHKGLPGTVRRWLSVCAGKPDFLAYDIRDLPSRFAAIQRGRGLPVLTWTVRSPELRERAALYADAPIAEGAGVEAEVA